MSRTPELRQFHRVIIALGLVTLGIFAIGIFGALFFFRGVIREQILDRDGVLLTSVAQHFYDNIWASDSDNLVEVALESSELRGVIGLRLFNPEGENIARMPAAMYSTILSPADLDRLRNGDPVVRHFPQLPLDTLFSDEARIEERSTFPTTEVLAPVFTDDGQLEAVLQYWLDGATVAGELGHTDQFLLGFGIIVFTAGSLIFLLVFLIARGRLLRMGLLLARNNESLRKANADLALAARTSAIGSITGHLFHGLKNPLAGLKAYLQLTGKDEEAMAMANRMQSLINESLSIIAEEDNHRGIQLSLDELLELMEQRFRKRETARLQVERSGDCQLSGRDAQILLLVLQNLVDNALEAASGEDPVRLLFSAEEDKLRIMVEDKGPGLPESVRNRVFEPVQSTKQNGTGIGLAISAALARHISAKLDLVKSDPQGTTFSLELPL